MTYVIARCGPVPIRSSQPSLAAEKGTIASSANLTAIISLLSMLYTYMKCYGQSSPSSPPALTTHSPPAPCTRPHAPCLLFADRAPAVCRADSYKVV